MPTISFDDPATIARLKKVLRANSGKDRVLTITSYDLGRMFGCSHMGVYKRALKLGYQFPSKVFWNADRNAELRAYADGFGRLTMSIKDLAKVLGCSSTTLQDQVETLGLSTYRAKGDLDEGRETLLRSFVSPAGVMLVSVHEIAHLVGCAVTTVRKRMHEEGWKTRRGSKLSAQRSRI